MVLVVPGWFRLIWARLHRACGLGGGLRYRAFINLIRLCLLWFFVRLRLLHICFVACGLGLFCLVWPVRLSLVRGLASDRFWLVCFSWMRFLLDLSFSASGLFIFVWFGRCGWVEMVLARFGWLVWWWTRSGLGWLRWVWIDFDSFGWA